MILNPAGRSMDELDLNNYYDNYDTSSLGDANDQMTPNMGDDCIKHQTTFTVTDIQKNLKIGFKVPTKL